MLFLRYVPLAAPGFVTASILTFAHTVGEFGVVLMIGGNLPGITRVASVQIYDHVEALEYVQAHRLSAVMLGFSLWCCWPCMPLAPAAPERRLTWAASKHAFGSTGPTFPSMWI